MRLTAYTDYSLRILIFLGTKQSIGRDDLSTIAEIAQAYDISENHLMKAVHNLARGSWIDSVRGRNGGIRLNRAPDKIVIGEVIRTTEENFTLAECFDEAHNRCAITSTCKLKHLLGDALAAYMHVLDGATLSDMLTTPRATAKSLGLQTKPISPPKSKRTKSM